MFNKRIRQISCSILVIYYHKMCNKSKTYFKSPFRTTTEEAANVSVWSGSGSQLLGFVL